MGGRALNQEQQKRTFLHLVSSASDVLEQKS